jgi:hypothetical protein
MAIDRIGHSFLVSEFRFRTKIALAIVVLELNLLMNRQVEVGAFWLATCIVPRRSLLVQ